MKLFANKKAGLFGNKTSFYFSLYHFIIEYTFEQKVVTSETFGIILKFYPLETFLLGSRSDAMLFKSAIEFKTPINLKSEYFI